jgi:pimeloyl-ACP methyl ester carboxylesterase
MTSEIAVSPELFAEANGQRLCYQTFGDGRAPVILLIMGLGAQMVLWDEDFCTALAARGYRVVRFDNRDIGRSSKIDVAVKVDFADLIMKQMRGEKIVSPYTLRDMAADACGLLDHLSVSRAHIVGASMGGMIAQEMAINFPERMLTLTSIMSSTGNPTLPPPAPEATAVLLAPPPTNREDYLASFARTWRVLRVGSFPADEANDLARGELTFERGLNPMGVARQMLAIFASGDRRAKLAQVKIPTLVIHGDVDPLVRLAAGEDTAKTIPGASLVVVKDMGHAMPTPLAPQIIDAIAAHVGTHAG